MAKCRACGKKGFFLKVNTEGLCSDCHSLSIRSKEIEALERRANDAATLLNEAMEKAKTQAHKTLAEEEERLNASIATLIPQLTTLREEYSSLILQKDAAEKRLKTAENRIVKSKQIFQSMKYAMDSFMNPYSERSLSISDFNVDLSEIVADEPELKCLSMKSLRSLYRQNEKRILETTTAYQSQYTTKANATIYKLMVMALNAEMNLILTGLGFGKLDNAIEQVKSITARYYTIAAKGNQTIVNTLNRFIGQIEALYIESVKIEYEYYVQRERAKEEQRALREQMRQEAEERKQLEAQQKQVEKEEKKYDQEMDRINTQLTQTNEQSEIDKLKKRLEELLSLKQEVAEKKEEIIRLQNGKAGTVYIISNLGSFGDHTFKIGMTRRMEPQERINELGDASVPFPFDVHSFIFSEDAVSLENRLHKELNHRRVNKVNLRKEYFDITLDELEALVERIDPSAPFQKTMLAEQYHQSLSIDIPVAEQVDLETEDLN